MEAASDGSLARLIEEIDSAADLLMDNCDDDDDGRGGQGGGGEEDKEDSNMNLILVTNLNVRVVVCDCGRGYKIPEVTEVAENEKEAAEPNNNCVVIFPDNDDQDASEKKGRY